MAARKVLRPERIAWFWMDCLYQGQRTRKRYEIKIKKLCISRRAVRTAMNENRDPFIYKLLPEIASHIFIQFLPQSGCFDISPWSSPLYLGGVCKNLAWTTREL